MIAEPCRDRDVGDGRQLRQRWWENKAVKVNKGEVKGSAIVQVDVLCGLNSAIVFGRCLEGRDTLNSAFNRVSIGATIEYMGARRVEFWCRVGTVTLQANKDPTMILEAKVRLGVAARPGSSL